MADDTLLFSPKYRAFLNHHTPVEFLEGTTYAGKTTVAAFKFMLEVYRSDKKLHILSGLDLGTIEKNIINKDLGILDVFGAKVRYNASGRGQHSLPHLAFDDKIIYVLGYDNKARWKKALGGQYGCVKVDELNIADMEFVREVFMRCDYFLGTLNPDDPGLPVYEEYINHSRPLPEYAGDAPEELNAMLDKEPRPGWVHWFFSFDHNPGLTEEKKARVVGNVPEGTKLYKNKILGLRGRSTGLIFNLEGKHILTREQAKPYHAQTNPDGFKYIQFSCGVDTSYSRNSDDTFAFVFSGFTACRKKITLATRKYNNKHRAVPLAPSDIPPLLVSFLEACHEQWGFAKNVFIDSADQATIEECQKYKRQKGSIYTFQGAFKKTKVLDRINMQIGWMASGDYFILDECKEEIDEMNLYSWLEDKDVPEDRNDHAINADQYSWLPFRDKIGQARNEH